MVAQQKIKDSSELNPGSPKSRLAVASMLKRTPGKTKLNNATVGNDPFRFQGDGVDCKGKLIGERDVSSARGDAMCAEAMRVTKAAIKSAGTHKQRIILNISVEGLKIKEEKSGAVLFSFPVSKISFIARDTTDARAFGFIFGTPEGKYKFYGIKTAQTADNAVLLIREMFQVVFEMKKKQVQEAKQKKEEQENLENSRREEVKGFRVEEGVPVGDLLDLETELESIAQGFHQLENIPSMPDDQPAWPTTANLNGFSDPFNSTTASSTADPFNVSFVTPQHNGHHQNSFWSQHTTVLQSSTNPFMQPVVANGYDNHNSAIQRPIPSIANNSPFGLAPPPQRTPSAFENGLGSAGSSVNGQHSPENNWGTSSASSKENEPTNGHVFQVDFKKQMITETSNDIPVAKGISLEDAFTKLVDMEKLVDSSKMKTNPFEHIINPPQLPLSAISSSFQTKTSTPLFQQTTASDPFKNDPFFN
ncbi:PID domain-containing protein [Aphelenchoides besseyi]|nr:PID domain-containing protein [Aphelenchoides besseyi]KAI6194322.1 PID domain-containing protein [Aphelenchoides besseyi]